MGKELLTPKLTFIELVALLAMEIQVSLFKVISLKEKVLKATLGIAINFVYDARTKAALDAISKHYQKKIEVLRVCLALPPSHVPDLNPTA